MCNYFYFRTVYTEHILLVIHAQTLQYFFVCNYTKNSHTLLYYILKNMYINSLIIAGKFVVFVYNYVKK